MDKVRQKHPQVKIVATTLREVHSTNRHSWSAVAWINGKTHLGTSSAQVPTIFGMNFQAVSVGQKLIENVKGGYTDAAGDPTAELATEIKFVDAAIGQFISALKQTHLLDSTTVIVTAKHGQSPIDTHRFFPIPGHSRCAAYTGGGARPSMQPDRGATS